MKKFAQLLDTYIESSGLKQTHIASTAHISYNYLLRLLAGNRNPSELVVAKLAEALRLSPEQSGELFAAAGYAPPLNLLQSPTSQRQMATPTPLFPADISKAARFIQQFHRLTQEVPEPLLGTFFEEMNHFLGYARYKYTLSGGMNPLDLHVNTSQFPISNSSPLTAEVEQSQLNLLAQIIGELNTVSDEDNTQQVAEISQFQQQDGKVAFVDGTLAIDTNAEGLQFEDYQPQIIKKIFAVLQEGASWDARYHVTKALSDLYRLDVSGTEQLMSVLRLDKDEVHGADIRRRVVEALPILFEASPLSLPTIIDLLKPVIGDDIYVVIATVEACGDIQDKTKQILERSMSRSNRKKPLESKQTLELLQKYQAEIPKIQRQLLFTWEGVEREYIQFSMALHDLLCAPDTLLLSLKEGLQSTDKLMQLVASRYLERLIPTRPLEVLEIYKAMLQEATSRNVRRTVAKASPYLLHCLQEASLAIRTLARTVISMLTTDSDIYIRRAVADYAMQLLYIDREFLLIVLRQMHKDKDQTIRNRLQPVVLRLAQIWLTSYAETAGLINARSSQQTHKSIMAPHDGNEVE